jgi:hypothetical protein
MREIFLLVSNYLIFIVMTALLAGMQSSLWHLILGVGPAPYFWLTIVVYWTLHRNVIEGIIMSYIVVFYSVTMSSIPLNMSFAITLAIYGTLFALKDRVLWTGVNSFMLASGLAALALPVYNLIFSFAIESRPISQFHFFDTVIRGLLTAAAAMPLYFLFTWVDKLTYRTTPTENESGVI